MGHESYAKRKEYSSMYFRTEIEEISYLQPSNTEPLEKKKK